MDDNPKNATPTTKPGTSSTPKRTDTGRKDTRGKGDATAPKDPARAKKAGPTFGDVAKRLREDPGAFAEYVIGEKPTYRGRGEVRFYPHQSLVVNTAGPRQGTYYSFSNSDDRGDMLDLYQMVRGSSAHDAFLAAQSWLGSNGIDLSAPVQEKARDTAKEEAEARALVEKRIRTARWIWDTSSPTDGREEGLTYLKNRGITVPVPADTMRFRRLSAEDLRKMGATPDQIPSSPVVAVVLRASNAKGETTAVQQILTCEGKKISKVVPGFPNPKRTNGELTGSAVKLGGDKPERVILAEGPETALSLFQASGVPTWITLGTSNYTTLQMPLSVKEAIVAADLEESGVGLGSALRAAQFWDAAGVPKTGIAIPRIASQQGDFNDALQQSGEASVRAAVEGTFYGERNRAPGTVLVSPDARAAFHVWEKTGLETIVRVPGLNHRKERSPIVLENLVEPHHDKVLLIPREGYPIDATSLIKARPDLPITSLAPDSAAFLKDAKTPGHVEALVARETDMHAPGGLGTREALAFCLRRADAEALHTAGHKAVAVRSSGIERLDLGFMKGRKAFLCPVGNGSESDRRLQERLEEAGAHTTRIVWQLFKPDNDGYAMVRASIPDTYGASEAVAEGWKGKKMAELLRLSLDHGPQPAHQADDPAKEPPRKAAASKGGPSR